MAREFLVDILLTVQIVFVSKKHILVDFFTDKN